LQLAIPLFSNLLLLGNREEAVADFVELINLLYFLGPFVRTSHDLPCAG
jgi:hypothetical protein